MRKQKSIAAIAMTAALAGGALVGSTLGNPLASGAQDGTSTTTTAPASSSDKPAPEGRPDGAGRHRGPFDLEVAAKALGLSTDELRTQLEAGKSLADVAKAEGVDKQTLIDALVKAGEKRLDEAKAELPDRVAEQVEATPGEGGFGRGGHRGPGPRLEAAAKALGLSEDDLKAELKDGKTLAEIAKAHNVDQQKVIDALVAEVKAHTAQAVKDGKITQAQADERVKEATERITKMVDEGFPKGGPGGRGPRGDHPEPPADDDGGN
jgi:hypothetical protein